MYLSTKTYGGVEVHLHAFLTLGLEWDSGLPGRSHPCTDLATVDRLTCGRHTCEVLVSVDASNK